MFSYGCQFTILMDKKYMRLHRKYDINIQVSFETVEEELRQYLIGEHPIAGLYNAETGERVSLYTGFRTKTISRGK